MKKKIQSIYARSARFFRNLLHDKDKVAFLVVVILLFVLSVIAFTYLGKKKQNTSDSRLFWVIIFQCGTLGAIAAICGISFSRRLLPNIAIAAAWMILCVLWLDVNKAPLDRITIIDILVDAYRDGRMSSALLETLLKFYGIGFFGTVLVSLGPEIAKGIWSDEIRSTDNKSLLSKFKRDRRQILLRVIGNRASINGMYLRILAFGLAFAFVLVLVLVKAREYQLTFEADLLLLILSVSMEATGIFTHSIITDHALISAEKYYLLRRRKALSDWLSKDGWRSSEKVNAYFMVLIHTYCNHGLIPIPHDDLFPIPVLPVKPIISSAQMVDNMASDAKNLDIALCLIEHFDYTKEQYIDPIEEQYWINAKQSFEPAFALDIDSFLFSKEKNSVGRFPKSELHAIAMARDCFFTKQKAQWQDWLYTSGMSYETMVAELMLTYLRIKYLSKQSSPRNISVSNPRVLKAKSERKLDYASLMLEFPYIMEACIRKRYDYYDCLPGEDKKGSQMRDFFHLQEEGHPPKFRERVEQYYAEMYRWNINLLDIESCNKIADRFYHFLTYIYEDDNKTEQYLHRILPINSNGFKVTNDVSTGSILFAPDILFTLAYSKKQYINPAFGWEAIVQENVELVKSSVDNSHSHFRMPRLCLYSVKDRKCKNRVEQHDGGRHTGYCCVNRGEQCESLVSILYELNKKVSLVTRRL